VRVWLLAAAPLLEEASEHGERFLGIPMAIWQLANLVAFLAVLLYFVARPLAAAFRQRQVEVEKSIEEARQRRAEAARLESEVHERMTRLDRELEEIRARGVAEGEAARAELIERADREAERVRQEAEEEIQRSLLEAREELRRAAADLTASAARELLAREINDDDRRRLLEEGLANLEKRA
jgi:F-type H+-transporting ATPase subunit b